MKINYPNQIRGFALLAAIFVIVVISAAVSLSASLVVGEIRIANYVSLRVQAYYAAISGIEWAMYFVTHNPFCPANTTTSTADFPIEEFVVHVSCKQIGPYTEDSTYYIYILSATAVYGDFGSPTFIQKSVSQSLISWET